MVAYSVATELAPGEGSCPEEFFSTLCYPSRLWISNADGSDARELLPPRPGFTRESPVAWSPDGSRLLYRDDVDGLVLADPLGSDRQSLQHICEDGVCSGVGRLTFSPDGSRLAFVRSDVQDASVIAIMDLDSGIVVELDSTRISNAEPRGACEEHCDGSLDDPAWSPDGTRLVFARQATFNAETGEYETILLMVDADGSDLHQVVPTELSAITPSWSPDGAWIVFTSSIVSVIDPDTISESLDLYRARPDGSDLQRLTSDGVSARPNWTRDGRIAFVRLPGVETGTQTGFELWVMDADGTDATRLPADDLAALSAAGCVVCVYPPMDLGFELAFLNDALWQPGP
jgi:Tol biopolymer transport system component